MDRLEQRRQNAVRAISSLGELTNLRDPSLVERDATIKRFELAFETTWKWAKDFLWSHAGLDVASPKGVMRTLRELALLNEAETTQALVMCDDRNLTVHTYNDQLAVEIHGRIGEHEVLLRKIIARTTL